MQLAQRMSVLGTETAFEVLAKAKALEAQGKDIVHLHIGAPDFRTPENIVEAGRKALKDGYHAYTPAKPSSSAVCAHDPLAWPLAKEHRRISEMPGRRALVLSLSLVCCLTRRCVYASDSAMKCPLHRFDWYHVNMGPLVHVFR